MTISPSSEQPRLAFFGATGGCNAQALALALSSGYKSTALARTPSKLTTLLKETYSVPQSAIDANLTIIQGDVKDHASVRRTIFPSQSSPSPSSQEPNHPADIILYGVGSVPKLIPSLKCPVGMLDPTLCADGMRVVVDVLEQASSSSSDPTQQQQQQQNRPLVVAVSTTGLSPTRDVPLALYPLYHWLLAIAHDDKRAMEDALVRAGRRAVADFLVVRPSLLLDGPPRADEGVRVGWEYPAVEAGEETGGKEREEAKGPAIGYAVRRSEVGSWIFGEVVGKVGGRAEWAGRCVTITR